MGAARTSSDRRHRGAESYARRGALLRRPQRPPHPGARSQRSHRRPHRPTGPGAGAARDLGQWCETVPRPGRAVGQHRASTQGGNGRGRQRHRLTGAAARRRAVDRRRERTATPEPDLPATGRGSLGPARQRCREDRQLPARAARSVHPVARAAGQHEQRRRVGTLPAGASALGRRPDANASRRRPGRSRRSVGRRLLAGAGAGHRSAMDPPDHRAGLVHPDPGAADADGEAGRR